MTDDDVGDVNLNVGDYSVDELYELVDLPNPSSSYTISDKMKSFFLEYRDNQPLYKFFIDVQRVLLDNSREVNLSKRDAVLDDGQYIYPLEDVGGDVDDGGVPTSAWMSNMMSSAPTRKDDTAIIDDNRATMGEKQKSITNTFPLSVIQGTLNPNLKNTYTRTVSIDSRYMQTLRIPNLCDTNDEPNVLVRRAYRTHDFTMDLSEPLSNVINMKFIQCSIPCSYYTFAQEYGTATFYVLFAGAPSKVAVQIDDGMYTANNLISALNARFVALSLSLTATLNVNTNKVTLASTNDVAFSVYFYSENVVRDEVPLLSNGLMDNNLGWLLGFHSPSYVGAKTYTGDSVIDVYGPRYILVAIDDFNRNHLNRDFISVSDNQNLPSTYNSSPSFYACDLSNQKLSRQMRYAREQIGLAIDAPKARTSNAPSMRDVLAQIPIKRSTNAQSGGGVEIITNDSSNLLNNSRDYFGPVTIKRLRVMLFDDRGNPLNLNGLDYNFSLLVTQIYQY